MLTIFPDLLTYSLAAPFIIRLALGLYALTDGFALLKQLYKKNSPAPNAVSETGEVAQTNVPAASVGRKSIFDHIHGWAAIMGSILVLAGAWMQIGALVLGLLYLYLVLARPENRVVHLLLFAMAASLLFSGAGFWAFDLPL